MLIVSQAATVGAALAAVYMIAHSFSAKSGMHLNNDGGDDDYTGILRPVNMTGISLLLYVVPAGIAMTWWTVEAAHRLQSRTPLLVLLGALGVEFVALAATALAQCGTPADTFAVDRDPLQQFIGGWLFAAGMPLGLACLVLLAWHVSGGHVATATAAPKLVPHSRPSPVLPAFPSTLSSNACGIGAALFAALAFLFATGCFSSIWNFSAGSYFPATSPYALNPESWSIGSGDKAFIFKMYPDPLIFYCTIMAVVLGGAATYCLPLWRSTMHKRVGGGSPAPAGTWARWLHPFPWGTTVGEVLVVSLLVMLYVAWFLYWSVFFTHIEEEAKSNGQMHPQFQRWARVFGHMTTLSFALLMLPVARDSVWTCVFGVSFERAVKLHRWLGAAAYAWLTMHMLTWWIMWGMDGVLGNNIVTTHNLVITNREGGGQWKHFDNFTMPFVHTAWLLLTLSIAVTIMARRVLFDYFYSFHAYVGVVVLVTGMMHAWSNWYFTAFGLTLYYFDRTWRFLRRTHAATASAEAIPGSRITRLTLPAQALRTSLLASGGHTAGQYAWLHIPAVSQTAWHPFTISSAPCASQQAFTFHIKAMGDKTWTDDLFAVVSGEGGAAPGSLNQRSGASAALLGEEGVPLQVAVDGPYGRPANFMAFPHLVLVAGGIGITPMLAILSEIVHRRRMGETGGPVRVAFVWSVREPGLLREFGLALFELLSQGAPADLHVSVQLYCKALHQDGASALPASLLDLPAGAGAWIQERTTTQRPQVRGVVQKHHSGAAGAPGLVMACGPKGLVDDASVATTAVGWEFHFEEFSW